MVTKKILFFVLAIVLSTLFPSAQTQKFAIISDTHINVGNKGAREDLENAVNSINANKDIQFVLVSGDITEGGDKKSLEEAKSILDQLDVKYYITSGNHETKWSESGVTDFGKIFGSDRFDFSDLGYYFLGFNSGPVIRMMDGHIAKQDLTWLKQKLDSLGKEQPVIIVTHYPLLDGDVDNWYEATDLLNQYNVELVLTGHYHRNKQMEFDGIPAFINRSSLRGKDAVGGYSIYSITPDSIFVAEQIINEQPKVWGKIAKRSGQNKNSIEYPRPDYNVNQEYSNVKEIWMTAGEGAIYCSPIVENNKVYVGDDLGNMLCLSLKTGKILWKFKTGNRIFGTPAVNKGILVFGSTDGKVYGLNSTTGKVKWTFEAKAPVLGGVAIDDNMAYIGGSDGCFYSLDLKTGKEIWKYCDVKGYIETRPLVYKDNVYFGAWDSYMYALNKKTGKLDWKWNKGRSGMLYSPAAVWPVAANNKLYFTAPDRFLTAVDITTGDTNWRTDESVVRETIGLSEDEKIIYSKTMQDLVVAYAIDEDTPKLLWSTNVGFGYEHAPSMPQEKDGVVFGSTKNGLIFAIDGKTGELLWKHKVGNTLINTVVPLSKNECVFASADGTIGLLKYEK